MMRRERKSTSQRRVENLLSQGKERLAQVQDFTVENTEKAYRDLIEELNIKGGQIIHPTRLALTGRTAGPGLFDVMALLGKERCLKRLLKAIEFIKTYKGRRTLSRFWLFACAKCPVLQTHCGTFRLVFAEGFFYNKLVVFLDQLLFYLIFEPVPCYNNCLGNKMAP